MYLQKTPERNAILFVWFNQYSGILLKTPSKTFIIDPVDIKAKKIQELDAILITHEHYDHLDQRLTADLQKATGAIVIADSTSSKKLQHIIPADKLKTIYKGMEMKVGSVSIRAEKSEHNAESPVTYIITSEDGVKTYHTADSLPFPELALMGLREKFDMVFCTVGIAPGTSPETGFEIARLTKPQIAVPYHTNTAASQTAFAQLLKKQLPRTGCLIPEQNKIYQVSKKR
jgi:L-ascorbate metabolism protein UlaG (beta-lactamase superfamily)